MKVGDLVNKVNHYSVVTAQARPLTLPMRHWLPGNGAACDDTSLKAPTWTLPT
jgi:hypothetical protein